MFLKKIEGAVSSQRGRFGIVAVALGAVETVANIVNEDGDVFVDGLNFVDFVQRDVRILGAEVEQGGTTGSFVSLFSNASGVIGDSGGGMEARCSEPCKRATQAKA